MKFESKYNIGDRVTVILRTGVSLPPERCSACDGEGTCILRGAQYACPKCHGKKTTEARGYGWVVYDSGVVQYIQCETIKEYDDADDLPPGATYRVKYMFVRHGTGSVYNEADLWPRNEAQAECDRRNKP